MVVTLKSVHETLGCCLPKENYWAVSIYSSCIWDLDCTYNYSFFLWWTNIPHSQNAWASIKPHSANFSPKTRNKYEALKHWQCESSNVRKKIILQCTTNCCQGYPFLDQVLPDMDMMSHDKTEWTCLLHCCLCTPERVDIKLCLVK